MRFDIHTITFKGYQISDLYGLIQRRRNGGGDLIRNFCSMLTNDGMKKKSGYLNRILEWTSEGKKRDGMNCLKMLYLSVFGMEMKQQEWQRLAWGGYREGRLVYTGRRMREVWIDEGKEDEEERREWERRWREAGDRMVEEDVMETSVIHLCIPDEMPRKDILLVPTECSYNALSVLLNERIDTEFTYHFPVYDITCQPPNVVIVRNYPSQSQFSNSTVLKALTDSICRIASIKQAHAEKYEEYGVVKVQVNSREDAMKVVELVNGCAFHGNELRMSIGMCNAETVERIRR